MKRIVLSKRTLVATMVAAAALPPMLALAQQGQSTAPTAKSEKCYGIAKAGKNDCASTGNNSCAGTSKMDGDRKAWLYVPAGYCERIVGGHQAAT